MKRFLSLLLILLCVLMLTSCSTKKVKNTADTASTTPPILEAPVEDYPVATVNGEDLMYSKYKAIESAYLYQYESAGVDLTDESIYAYLTDLALSYALEQMLVDQDMRAQGCYTFDEETENWFAQSGKAAWDQALQDVMESMRTADSSDDELMVYALVYADSLGVTEQTYVDYFRTAYAQENYRQWLIRETPITDADVQAAYEERIASSQALYENDVAAFESALLNGTETWYTPAGYRNVLQILLPAEGDTAEAKLLSVQSTVDEITARLANGEAFESLIPLYSADAATPYPVHLESTLWADEFVVAAFSAEMAAPGSVSLPVVSDLGVHILYYLSDAASGAVPLTDEIHELLAAQLYQERYTAAQTVRLNELSAAAEVVIHE